MKNTLVTGGGGFVGESIVRLLIRKGCDVRVIGRNRYPEIENLGVTCIQGNISDRSFILKQLKDIDTVFHVAAIAGIWGTWQSFFQTNVQGTRNIIQGCYENNIAALVYTSTPSVVFNRKSIIEGDEALPYPKSFLCNYARSKTMAEKEILETNQVQLKTCAIRPHLIWGPRDPHIIPRLLERGRRRELKIVGEGENLVDVTYIDNVAHAHILAAENLHSSCEASGQAYFIGQERPVVLWQWINELFDKMNIPLVEKKVPLPVAYGVGALLESLYTILQKDSEPRMTRFLAEQLGTSHYFSHKKAKKDLNYTPTVSLEEGMDRLIHWLKSQ